MPTFKYKARDKNGKAVTGLLEGASKAAVAEQISRMGYLPVAIHSETEKREAQKGKRSRWVDRFTRRVNLEELIYFCRQMALVLGAGVPILASLRMMAKQTTNQGFKDVLVEIADDIEGGTDLSEAMAAYPTVFSTLFVNMMRAGEASGQLESTLIRLAELLEYEMETRERVKEATRYPKLVVGALVTAFFVAVYFIIPTFAKLFRSFGADLPLPTRLLIALDAHIKEYWVVSLLGLVILVIMVVWWSRTTWGRYRVDALKLRIPVFGGIISKFVLSRFSKVFATLNANGLPILKTLKISTETVGNAYYERALDGVTEEVKRGENLSDALGRAGIFPPLLHQMAYVGETAGKLDEILTKVSEYYDQEVDYATKRLTTLIEPALIATLAGFVLFFALAVFLPLFDMAKVIIGK